MVLPKGYVASSTRSGQHDIGLAKAKPDKKSHLKQGIPSFWQWQAAPWYMHEPYGENMIYHSSFSFKCLLSHGNHT